MALALPSTRLLHVAPRPVAGLLHGLRAVWQRITVRSVPAADVQRLPVVCARALAFTGRLLDGDDPLRCDERSLAALRDGLAGHTRALAREMKTRGERPLPAGPFGPVERVERLIDDSRSQTGLGALIALVMAAEQLRELALPARPRAGCSTGAPSSAAPGSVR